MNQFFDLNLYFASNQFFFEYGYSTNSQFSLFDQEHVLSKSRTWVDVAPFLGFERQPPSSSEHDQVKVAPIPHCSALGLYGLEKPALKKGKKQAQLPARVQETYVKSTAG